MRILNGRKQRVLVYGVSSDNQKMDLFSIEKKLYIYLSGLLIGMKIAKITVTARSLNYNRFGWFR